MDALHLLRELSADLKHHVVGLYVVDRLILHPGESPKLSTENLFVVQISPGFPNQLQVRVLHRAWHKEPFLANIIDLVETSKGEVGLSVALAGRLVIACLVGVEHVLQVLLGVGCDLIEQGQLGPQEGWVHQVVLGYDGYLNQGSQSQVRSVTVVLHVHPNHGIRLQLRDHLLQLLHRVHVHQGRN